MTRRRNQKGDFALLANAIMTEHLPPPGKVTTDTFCERDIRLTAADLISILQRIPPDTQILMTPVGESKDMGELSGRLDVTYYGRDDGPDAPDFLYLGALLPEPDKDDAQ